MKAIIFDFNGTIVDDEPVHFECFNKVLDKNGIPGFSYDDYKEKYISMSDKECFASFLNHGGNKADKRLISEMIQQKAVFFSQMQDTLKPFTGVIDFVRKSVEEYTLAIGTRAPRHEVELFLQKEGIRKEFKVIVSAEDFEKRKPDPECFLKVLVFINLIEPRLILPNECVVIEDTPDGIEAAKNAGMKCIGVANVYPKERLSLADAIVTRLMTGDLKARIKSLKMKYQPYRRDELQGNEYLSRLLELHLGGYPIDNIAKTLERDIGTISTDISRLLAAREVEGPVEVLNELEITERFKVTITEKGRKYLE